MNTILKVEDVKRPLVKGEKYSVLCIVKQHEGKLNITPVINHPHDDIENGQPEEHYHVDYRFVKHKNDKHFPTVINKHSKHYFVDRTRLVVGIDGELERFILPVINEDFTGITPVDLIGKSNLSHKCINKGKCPHRGYDLSQTPPINGKITCPLHGLEFDAVSGEILNFNK